ncbi:hypothetical protein D9756_003377 [Leucocoprinus leucothites]|uniref:Protein arginine N-methyltransferase n=1 Tax=Leucocoprinus leucothites TaxID=201217 RepID=A0A8H5G6G6_9AGAR|nr:hypothetical protein D9756_003377 [Leucoagaricus leucothites]
MPQWDHFPSAGLATFLTLHDIHQATTEFTPPPNGHTTQHLPHAQNESPDTPVRRLIQDTRNKGYETICLPLTTEKWKERWEGMCLLPSSPIKEEPESADVDTKKKEIARAAELWRARPCFLPDEALQQELAYASYLSIHTVILPAPRNRSHVASYARIINNCLKNTPYLYLSVRLPIYNPTILHQAQAHTGSGLGLAVSPASTPALIVSPDPSTPSQSTQNGISPESEMNATWEMWDVIRSICDYNTRLTLTLDLTPPLPSKLGVLSKWAAESVRYIFLPASTFIANTKGYPVLPKPTQSFIRDSMIHRPTVILAEVTSDKHSRGGEAAYSQYIKFLEKTSAVVRNAQKEGTVEHFAQGYQDYLQAPLQPLMDNLQSITYQTFEQDPVKYERYEEAIFRALMEWPVEGRIVCCVAGAGRGPLVARCLNAVQRSGKEVFVYAVEKNPNAYVTLQQRKDREWGDKIKLLFGDMRSLDIPEPADILVSELLGSFGDNELSPECLDGAQRFLKPTGISIPSSYTSHLAPLSSSKLYNEARASKNAVESLETPYVVMFQAVNILSEDKLGCGAKIQECWEFEHPRRDGVMATVVVDERGLPLTNNHNVRSARLRFWIPHAGVLHGLAGYFEAVLYGNIGLSIHPHRKDQISKDMLSWFPLFFPFKEPLYLPSNSELQVSIWRLTNERQVWYEWHAESFLTVPLAPPGVKSDSDGTPTSGAQGQGWAASSPLSVPSPLADDDGFFSSSTTAGGNGGGASGSTGGEGSTIGTRRGSSSSGIRTPGRVNRSVTLPHVFGGGGVGGGASAGAGGGFEVVKIGHTSLHNPGGRSSWIGL